MSVQVETAGNSARNGVRGIDQDLRDFRSSRSSDCRHIPTSVDSRIRKDIPLDYYARVKGSRSLPVMVVEGGWPSASVRGVFSSSAEMQARYIARQSQLLDQANAIVVFQLSFADLDLGSFPKFYPTILPLFATLGLVDVNLRPKPALAAWDTIFARHLDH